MSRAPKILALAGSARKGSFNKLLLHAAAAGARAAGAEVTEIDFRDLPMPLYDGDLEATEGLPPAAAKLRELLASHDGLLIASPENNSSISALLKNAIDWATRTEDASADISRFRGKVAALMAASPGALGGLRGLVHVRAILENIGCMVLPNQLTLRDAANAFDADGTIVDAKQRQRVEQLGAELARFLAKIV